VKRGKNGFLGPKDRKFHSGESAKKEEGTAQGKISLTGGRKNAGCQERKQTVDFVSNMRNEDSSFVEIKIDLERGIFGGGSRCRIAIESRLNNRKLTISPRRGSGVLGAYRKNKKRRGPKGTKVQSRVLNVPGGK